MKYLLVTLFILIAVNGLTAMSPRVTAGDSTGKADNALMSEEDYKLFITNQIASGKSCKADSDCVIAFPGCPFGCGMPMNAESSTQIKATVAEYYKKFPDSICKYKCAAFPEKTKCINNICEPE